MRLITIFPLWVINVLGFYLFLDLTLALVLTKIFKDFVSQILNGMEAESCQIYYFLLSIHSSIARDCKQESKIITHFLYFLLS